MVTIRPATQADALLVLAFIEELGVWHGLQGPCPAAPEDLARQLGDGAFLRSELAFVDGEPAGQALWHPNFDSWMGRRGVYLEDLWVRPAFRGAGVGRRLMVHMADLARREGGRLTWQAAQWNESGARFYRSLGARPLEDWRTWRLEDEGLDRLAGERP